MEKVYSYNTPENEMIFEWNHFRIEIDTDSSIVRVFKDDKCIKFWYDENTIQTSKLPQCCDVINEYTNIFNEK